MPLRHVRLVLPLAIVLAVGLCLPARADAQWFAEGAIGANHNLSSDLSVRQPSRNLALDFRDVRFTAEANTPRRYFVTRLGWLGPSGLGWEIEAVHFKAVADTSRRYDVATVSGGVIPAAGVSPMHLVVQKFRVTNGVNLGLFNIVLRRPLGSSGTGPVALALRAGAGLSLPHATTTVSGTDAAYGYEYGGPAAQAAAGLHVRLAPRVAIVAEYKFTYTRPTVDIADGTAWTTLLSHHVIAGLSLALTR